MQIDRFLKYIDNELNLSALTVDGYGNDLRQFNDFIVHLKGDADAAGVTPADIRAWVVDLADKGDCARTIRRKIQAVRAFYRYLLTRGVLKDNPAADVELAKTAKRLPQYVRQGNMDKLLDEEVDMSDFTAVRDRLVAMMLYETGIRRAELIGLKDCNVDTAKCAIKVHGKRDKVRIVPFGAELKEWIDAYRVLRDTECRGNETFFVRPDGKPLYSTLVYRIVHEALIEAGGCSKFSPHVLRHSFASALLNNGAQLMSVKELLGHESLASTQVYTHITFSELKDNYKHAHPRALKKGG